MLSYRAETIYPFIPGKDFRPPEALTNDTDRQTDEQNEKIDKLLLTLLFHHAESYTHTQELTKLHYRFTQFLGIPKDDSPLTQLHDIGKLSIPKVILAKTEKLTDQEFSLIKTHPQAGLDIVKRNYLSLPTNVLEVILQHHENWDGTGYPQGLQGEEISPDARIIKICDVYEALTGKRCYKDPWSPQKALDFIVKQSGQQFDPQLAESFAAFREEQLIKEQEESLPIQIPVRGTIFSPSPITYSFNAYST